MINILSPVAQCSRRPAREAATSQASLIETKLRLETTMTDNTTPAREAHHFFKALEGYKEAVVDVEAVCPSDNEDAYEAEIDAKVDVMFAMTAEIMAREAPTIHGAIAKLEIAIYRGENDIKRDHIESALADFMRLANLTHSPAMVPLEWLCQFERRGGFYDYDGADAITISANFDRPEAIRLIQKLSKQERATLADYIRGNKAA